MKVFEEIENHEMVTEAFGYWPTFHDAEIHRFTLERVYDPGFDCECAVLEFVLHAWEMKSQVVNGYYKLAKHHLVTFRFEHVDDIKLDGFNHQNAILSLDLELLPKDDRGHQFIRVVIDPAHGVGAEFRALKGKIIDVKACTQKGRMC